MNDSNIQHLRDKDYDPGRNRLINMLFEYSIYVHGTLTLRRFGSDTMYQHHCCFLLITFLNFLHGLFPRPWAMSTHQIGLLLTKTLRFFSRFLVFDMSWKPFRVMMIFIIVSSLGYMHFYVDTSDISINCRQCKKYLRNFLCFKFGLLQSTSSLSRQKMSLTGSFKEIIRLLCDMTVQHT